MVEKYTCIVCGRKFPKGQGIVINVGERLYTFHSKSCALKFFKRVIEELEPSEVARVFNKVAKEFEEELERKIKLRSKHL